MLHLILEEIDEAGKEASRTVVEKMEIPRNIKIPHWPNVLRIVKYDLGQREYPYAVQTERKGFFRIERRMHNVEVSFHRDGTFRFSFTGPKPSCVAGSDDPFEIDRLRALLLFHEFSAEIIFAVKKLTEEGIAAHNEVLEKAEEALAPFIPYLVAESLSSSE